MSISGYVNTYSYVTYDWNLVIEEQFFVIPAEAGIQTRRIHADSLDSGLRRKTVFCQLAGGLPFPVYPHHVFQRNCTTVQNPSPSLTISYAPKHAGIIAL